MSQPGVQCLCALLFLPALACATSLQADGAGDEFLVNAGATSAAAPDIGAAADGSFVICWQSTPDTPAAFAQIAAKRFGASTMALGDEFRVDSSATVGLDPAIAVDASGQFVVAWWHFDGFEIRGRRYAADASVTGPEFIASNPPFAGLTQIGNPAVADIFLDQFVVVWAGTTDFIRYDIAGRRIDSNGLPIGTGFVVNSAFAGNHGFAAVAADVAGNYVVAWHVGADILARKFTSAGVFGPPFPVASGASPGVALAADDAGNFVAVWPQNDTLLARRFAGDTLPLGAPFRIDQSGAASSPDVAMFADGGFVVAWQNSDGGFENSNVLARRFGADGSPAGDELTVNVTTAGGQRDPAIATRSDGSFVVAWTSQAPLANETDVHARRIGSSEAIFSDGFDQE